MVYQASCDLKVLINDRFIDEYSKDGKNFVEGRKGSTYALKYRNNTCRRQKVVLSVDGLNVMTGDATWDRAYVVEPWGNITVPGWRKDAGNVAAFEFSSIKESYNQHNESGESRNIGVIGCKVYNEVIKPPPTVVHHWSYSPYIWPHYYPTYYNALNVCRGVRIGSSYNMGDTEIKTGGASFASMSEGTPTMDCFQETSFVGQNVVGDNVVKEQLAPSANVGTGWGENKTFETTAVYYDFENNVFVTLLLYYDDRKGLQRRGIDIRDKVAPQAFPNAFPDGCPKPIYRD